MIQLAIPAALARYSGLFKVAGVVLAVLAALWWWNSHNAGQQRIGYERSQAERRADEEKAQAAQRLREMNNFRRMENAHETAAKLLAERDAARAAAGAADRRLRVTLDDFDRRLDGATRETAVVAARALRGVLDACVAEYRGVADAADGHLADAVTCRAGWPE